MTPLLAQGGRPFPDWQFLQNYHSDIIDRLVEHLLLTFLAVAIGMAIAFPLAILAVRFRPLYSPLLQVTGVLYTVPSLALFVLLVALGTGLTLTTALIGLTIYTLLILIRNIVTGLTGVPDHVVEAAEAMGYSGSRLLWRVRLPLAAAGDLRRHPHRDGHDDRAGHDHDDDRPGRARPDLLHRLPARQLHGLRDRAAADGRSWRSSPTCCWPARSGCSRPWTRRTGMTGEESLADQLLAWFTGERFGERDPRRAGAAGRAHLPVGAGDRRRHRGRPPAGGVAGPRRPGRHGRDQRREPLPRRAGLRAHLLRLRALGRGPPGARRGVRHDRAGADLHQRLRGHPHGRPRGARRRRGAGPDRRAGPARASSCPWRCR